jgi:hypothetical protein
MWWAVMANPQAHVCRGLLGSCAHFGIYELKLPSCAVFPFAGCCGVSPWPAQHFISAFPHL